LSEIGPDLADIMTVLPTAILVIDAAGRIAQTNPAAEMLLNISAQHLKGRMLADELTLPRGFDASVDGPYAAFDMRLSTGRGLTLRVDLEVSQFGDWPGWRLIALHSSATAHRMGQSLDRAGGTRAAAGVAAMLAHEIKNPLSGIRGAAQLLEGRADDDDRRMTTLIRTEVDRITALVDQMEGFTDTRDIVPTADNIHEIIDHARDVVGTGFGAQVRIVDAYDPSLPPVLVNRDAMIQILINLIKNAAETAKEGGVRTILLTTAYRHGLSISSASGQQKVSLPIEVCVIDDGPGAPPEIADDLFEPFVSSKKSGRGLGLALVDKLMRDMGGIIQYERSGRPEMTVFRLLLPRAGPGAERNIA
jgi:two-component system, NtrC family, nitrogen regulation sensor histidine kinase GlnL